MFRLIPILPTTNGWLSRVGASARRITLLFVGLAAVSLLQADDAAEPAEVPSFYVRAVTGPLAGKSVCYVCRNADRPVVVVLLRDLDRDVATLLKELDQTVNQHRADGLRCFAVLVSDSPQRDSARLQTLAFDEKIDLPLTVASEGVTQGSTLAVPRDVAISVVTYKDRRICQRFEYKPGACDKQARQAIVAASQKLIEMAN